MSASQIPQRPLRPPSPQHPIEGQPSQPIAEHKPNVLIFWGDDIGMTNCSCYGDGIMGYRTPNIDRIAQAGVRFTDCYAEQSCTAGRASLMTGQHGLRTGLVRVGMPGDDEGISFEDPTVAQLLRPHGYATGQFGKNHFGDRNQHLPTVHGFDEFIGNLYHLNAQQEPQHPDYPTDPNFAELFGPRGVLDCKAIDHDDATVDPRWGHVGKQVIIDTGPLDVERMRVCDDEFISRAIDFIRRCHANGTPFFCHIATTHMHYFTWPKQGEQAAMGGSDTYANVMVDHDRQVGQMLDLLDELGITGNTMVFYSTDNGPHINEWPDSAMTPFRNEKNTNWEGAYRVPSVMCWPDVIPGGQVLNGIVSHLDWLPTILAAVGEADIGEKLKAGHQVGERTYKVHLDGYNMLPYLTGEQSESPRVEFIYCDDDRLLTGLRLGPWKFIFREQRLPGTMGVWAEPMVTLRRPKFFNLRMDPFERAEITSNMYWFWLGQRAFLVMPAIGFLVNWAQSFKEFPPRILGDHSVEEEIQHLVDGLKHLHVD